MEPRAVDNPKNPYQTAEVDYLEGSEAYARVRVYEDHTKSILSENDSPDLGFRYSVNPYRGCQHACAYCYARPGHEYLSWGAGTDFDTKLVMKPEAPALLRAAFDKPSWRGEVVVFSGVTDCYQPIEASYRLTRACLEVCADYQNPVGIITKAPLIERDVDVLLRLRERARVHVSISVPFIDAHKARLIEPWVATPQRRLRTIEVLARAGITVGVMVGPVIPGLSDEDMPAVLEAARAAGATMASWVLLRLPGSVKDVFEARLRQAFPDRADKVLHRVRETRQGALYNPKFGARQVGEGVYAEAIQRLFSTTVQRLGLHTGRGHDGSHWAAASTFRRPERPAAASSQLSLWGPSSG